MWCKDCFFRIEDKTITPNPFYVEKENQGDVKQEKSDQSGLGEQLAAQHEKKKQWKKAAAQHSQFNSISSHSFITATLGTNGWLGLIRQGLSPCKKRQASLGALTVSVSGGGAGVDKIPRAGFCSGVEKARKCRGIPTVHCTLC
jgi:hypothetical protein